MKYSLTILTLSALFLALNAFETVQSSQENEFPYIKPISVEYMDKAKDVDSDEDGVFDSKDLCSDTIKDTPVDETGCELDSDEDGVLDSKDLCSDTIKDTPVDETGCELDSDEDGVLDSKDLCPNTTKEFQADADGCPSTATLEVHFLSNDYAVSDTLIDDLKSFAQFLKDNSGYKVLIKGYTDSSGDEYKNKILSQNRANSVKAALVRYGIDKNRLISVGKGSLNPIADNATIEGRIRNRRIEVELIK